MTKKQVYLSLFESSTNVPYTFSILCFPLAAPRGLHGSASSDIIIKPRASELSMKNLFSRYPDPSTMSVR